MSFLIVFISKRIIVSGNDDDPDVSHSLLYNNNDDIQTLTKHVEGALVFSPCR